MLEIIKHVSTQKSAGDTHVLPDIIITKFSLCGLWKLLLRFLHSAHIPSGIISSVFMYFCFVFNIAVYVTSLEPISLRCFARSAGDLLSSVDMNVFGDNSYFTFGAPLTTGIILKLVLYNRNNFSVT